MRWKHWYDDGSGGTGCDSSMLKDQYLKHTSGEECEWQKCPLEQAIAGNIYYKIQVTQEYSIANQPIGGVSVTPTDISVNPSDTECKYVEGLKAYCVGTGVKAEWKLFDEDAQTWAQNTNCHSTRCWAVEIFDQINTEVSLSGYYDVSQESHWNWHTSGPILETHQFSIPLESLEAEQKAQLIQQMLQQLHDGKTSESVDGQNRVEEWEVKTKDDLFYVCPAMTCVPPDDLSSGESAYWKLDDDYVNLKKGTTENGRTQIRCWRKFCSADQDASYTPKGSSQELTVHGDNRGMNYCNNGAIELDWLQKDPMDSSSAQLKVIRAGEFCGGANGFEVTVTGSTGETVHIEQLPPISQHESTPSFLEDYNAWSSWYNDINSERCSCQPHKQMCNAQSCEGRMCVACVEAATAVLSQSAGKRCPLNECCCSEC